MKNFLNQTIQLCQQTFGSIDRSMQIGRRLVSAGLLAVVLWGLSVPAAQAVPYEKNDDGRIQTTERYDQIQQERGGMNNFDAVDPRFDANEDKAQILSDTAKRRAMQADDPLETAREAIGDLKDKVSDTASDIVQKVK